MTELFPQIPRGGLGIIVAITGLLTGCVSNVDSPRPATVYVAPPIQIAELVVVVCDDYVYYPVNETY